MIPTGNTMRCRSTRGGRYHPAFEHDACGVGMICDIRNRRSHALIDDALQILINLTHRGACGCDETTGDGAGILMQKPHEFLRLAAREATIHLPAVSDYAAGLVFLPVDADRRQAAETAIAAEKMGLKLLGWRDVPVQPTVAGDLARRVMPVIRMVFVGKGEASNDALFERRLFLLRKAAEDQVCGADDAAGHQCHMVSLSARTLIYKGMLLADQMAAFFPDLGHPAMASALALVHQRYSTTIP